MFSSSASFSRKLREAVLWLSPRQRISIGRHFSEDISKYRASILPSPEDFVEFSFRIE
jgi:hypothetical protein